MQKLLLVLVLGALGLAGWQAYEASHVRRDLDEQVTESALLRGEVERVRRELAALQGVEAPLPLRAAEAPPPNVPEESTRLSARLLPRGASPEVIAGVVRDLQGRLEDQETELAALREEAAARPAPQRAWSRPTFIHDLDSAVKTLDLDTRQRADLDRVIDYTKRDLEDLHSIRNDEGKTWAEVAALKTTAGDGQGIQLVMSNFAALHEFQQSKIPGTNETFGQADRRIRDRGKKDVRDLLTPPQQETWDGARTDALFGRGSGLNVVTFATSLETSTDD